MKFTPTPLLFFNAANRKLALDARHLVTVTTTQDLRIVHNNGRSDSEVVAYNGQVIPLMNMTARITDCIPLHPILILLLKQRHVAIVVDQVDDVRVVPSSDIEVFPEREYDPQNLVHGIYKADFGEVLILDAERVFSPILGSKT